MSVRLLQGSIHKGNCASAPYEAENLASSSFALADMPIAVGVEKQLDTE